MPFTPSKLYYKIGEVCDIVGVESHVLRYWETEFPDLSPPKNRSGQRTYRPKDIELLLRIRKLLYEERFTIAGARKQLAAGKGIQQAQPAGQPRRKKAGTPPRKVRKQPGDRISEVREELQNILTLLDRE
ncbi:MAG TPA: MerR family transcriptional regulator [Acidobacteriota bacterium]|nr:MerR family transcriptional regulator [Acidobacteriota bacterium]